MNLSPEKFNILKHGLHNEKYLNNAAQNSHPKFQTTDISFRGSAADTFCKIVRNKEVTYTNAKAIISGVDAIVGDEFLTSLLKKANISTQDGNIVFKESSFFSDLVSTVGYIPKIPLDITISAAKGLRKFSFLRGACDGLLNSRILIQRQKVVEQEKSLSCAKALLEQFVSKQEAKVVKRGSKSSTLEYNLEKSLDLFKDSAAAGIINPARNYVIRDERALNRMGTLTVSALYSASDFYNITMLQKDDKNEAKKAEKSRRKQELLRMFFSGTTTYLSLGAFNKLTKNNVVASALVIAGSALIAEIGSRLLSHTPLKRLSPEQARQIAEENAKSGNEHKNNFILPFENKKKKANETKDKSSQNVEQNKPSQNVPSAQTPVDNKVQAPNNQQAQTSNDKQVQVQNNEQIQPQNIEKPSKSNPEFKSSKSYEKSVYKDFSGENSLIEKAKESSKPKKNALRTFLTAGFTIFSVIYLLKKGLGGEYFKKFTDKEVYIKNQDKIQEFLKGNLSDDEKEKLILTIKQQVDHKNGTKTPGDFIGLKYIDKIKEFWDDNVKHRKVKISLKKINDKLDILSLPENNKGIEPLLQAYKKQAAELVDKDGNVSVLLRRNITSGICGGFSKMYDLAYTAFTLPISMLEKLIDKMFKFKTSTDALDALYRHKEGIKLLDKKKSISQLAQTMFNKDEVDGLYGPIESVVKKRMTNDEIIDAIKKSTRNFDQGTETGELAHLSRSLVTLLTTYFFVNDYRNKVLIESKGKAVDEANREQKERIAHKLSNFVINGTLMNIFNSTFKRPLNESLLAATLVAMSTEVTNEYMVRKSICQPVGHMESKQELLDYEKRQLENDGFAGAWSRFFRKITGKKTLTQKAGINEEKK